MLYRSFSIQQDKDRDLTYGIQPCFSSALMASCQAGSASLSFPICEKKSKGEYAMLCISSSIHKVLWTCKMVHKILHAHELPITSAGSSTAECSPQRLLHAAAQEPPSVAQGWIT